MSVLLMLTRVLRDFDANSPDGDAEILADCKRTVREILEDAELRLWELEERGWTAPEDADDSISYAARLLLLAGRREELSIAAALAAEIVFRTADASP